MLEYFDPDIGESVYLHGIHGKGVAGQIVVLAEKFASDNSIFAGYDVPAIFTIDRAITDQPYVLKDERGKEIITDRGLGCYLYPLIPWFEWERGRHKAERTAREKRDLVKDTKIETLTGILTSQLRVITTEDLKKLGLESKT